MAKRIALINGKILTSAGIGSMEADEVEALLIEGNRIVEIGTTARILEMIGSPITPSIPVVDLQGMT
ncbi:MAG: hypothetical protein ACOYEQ_07125, partial [Bacillota bacterium]